LCSKCGFRLATDQLSTVGNGQDPQCQKSVIFRNSAINLLDKKVSPVLALRKKKKKKKRQNGNSLHGDEDAGLGTAPPPDMITRSRPKEEAVFGDGHVCGWLAEEG